MTLTKYLFLFLCCTFEFVVCVPQAQGATTTEETPIQIKTFTPRDLDVALIYKLDQKQLTTLYVEFAELIRDLGFSPAVLDKAQNIDTHSLLKLANINSPSARPQWDRIKENIVFWQQLLPANKETHKLFILEQFFLKTDHSNPFHILNIDIPSWTTFLELMLHLRIFSSINGPETRSFRSYVLRHWWLEGAQTSKTRTLDYWQNWSGFFAHSKTDLNKIGDALYARFFNPYKDTQQNDGVQSFYLALRPELYHLIHKYPHLMTPEVITGIFTLNLAHVAAAVEQLESLLQSQQNLKISPSQKTRNILRALNILIDTGRLPEPKNLEDLVPQTRSKRPMPTCKKYLYDFI